MPIFQNIIKTIQSPEECYKRRLELIREIEKITKRPLLVYVSDINKPESALKPEDKIGFSDLI